MADYYCDHGAYGLGSNRLGLDAPTWGVPQEGDGTTKDAATVSGTVSVDLTSITSNAGTVSIFGSAAISVGASASGSTLAAQIVAAINGSSLATSHASLPGAPQVRNLVWARNTGATLEIMCRIGSSALNVLGVVWGGTWTSSAPSNLTFSGGAGGCWGWFINPSAIGVSSSIAEKTYGSFLYKPYAGALPTADDIVYVRTGGGASKTIALSFSGNAAINHDVFSASLVFDTNTKWTSDVTNGQLKVAMTKTDYGQSGIYLSANGSSNSYSANAYCGFEIEFIGAQSSSSFEIGSNGNPSEENYKNVRFRDSTTSASGMSFYWFGIGDNNPVSRVFDTCSFIVTTPRSTIVNQFAKLGAYQQTASWVFRGCEFDFNISGVSDPGTVLTYGSTFYQSPASFVFDHCAFKGFSSGYRLIASIGSWLAANQKLLLIADGCSGLAVPANYVGVPTSQKIQDPTNQQIIISTPAEGMRIEDCRGVAEWLPNDPVAFPYLVATNAVTGANYSIRLIWIQAVPLTRGFRYYAPVLRQQNQNATAVRTLTLEIFIPSSVADGLSASFGYIDNTGIPRTQETSSIASSSVTWTNAGSYAGYASKKLSVTTDYQIANGCEITCSFSICKVAASATVALYIDPEFGVA